MDRVVDPAAPGHGLPADAAIEFQEWIEVFGDGTNPPYRPAIAIVHGSSDLNKPADVLPTPWVIPGDHGDVAVLATQFHSLLHF
jgi:hypothetical protein